MVNFLSSISCLYCISINYLIFNLKKLHINYDIKLFQVWYFYYEGVIIWKKVIKL